MKECQLCGEMGPYVVPAVVHSSCLRTLQSQLVALADNLAKTQLRVQALEKQCGSASTAKE